MKPVIRENATAIGLKHVEDPRRFGIAELTDGLVTRFVEKPEHPTSNQAIVGLYWIAQPKKLLEAIDELLKKGIKTKGEFQLTDALEIMRAKGEKFVPFNVEGWYDCGKPETLLATNRHLLDGRTPGPPIPGVVVVPPVFISPNAKITDSVIGPYASIADGVHVSDSIVRNSIISEDARVQRTLLESSIIGSMAAVTGSFKKINIGDSSEINFNS